MNKTRGFTIIELMIAVAIIGILAAIAIPAYQDYLTRSKVSEAMVFVGAAKTAVSEYYDQNHSYPTSLQQIGMSNTSSISGKYVTSLTIGTNGVITAEINYGSGTGTIVVTPSSTD